MTSDVSIRHVALQCSGQEKAEIFFAKILGIPKAKSFTLSEGLSAALFGLPSSVEIDVYDDGNTCFEIFITPDTTKAAYGHTCIEVNDKQAFVDQCKKHDLEPMIIKKEGKDLLFVKDFSGNLFEVKEKQR